jgi:hypothetical protein
MRKWLWEMLAQLFLLTFDASSFKMSETLIQSVRDQPMRFPLVHNLHFLVDIYRSVCHYLVALFRTTVNPWHLI